MARHPAPWYWKARDGWFTTVNGRQIRLAKGKANKDDAFKAFHRLLAADGALTPRDDLTLIEVCDLFLDHAKAVSDASTFATHRSRLQRVVREFGNVSVSKLNHVRFERWLAGLDRAADTKRGYIASVRRAIHWAVDAGILPPDTDPLKRVTQPPSSRRKRIVSTTESVALKAAASPAFRELVEFLEATACRPHLAYTMAAQHIDWERGIAVLRSKGRPYTIPLPADWLDRLRTLARTYPEGPLLRSPRGKPWDKEKVRLTFRQLAEKTGITGVTAYAFRHTAATAMLVDGAPPAAVAAVLNHKDLSMLSRFYNSTPDQVDLLRATAERGRAAIRRAAEDASTRSAESDDGPDPEPSA